MSQNEVNEVIETTEQNATQSNAAENKEFIGDLYPKKQSKTNGKRTRRSIEDLKPGESFAAVFCGMDENGKALYRTRGKDENGKAYDRLVAMDAKSMAHAGRQKSVDPGRVFTPKALKREKESNEVSIEVPFNDLDKNRMKANFTFFVNDDGEIDVRRNGAVVSAESTTEDEE